jgi:hypothetical protein
MGTNRLRCRCVQYRIGACYRRGDGRASVNLVVPTLHVATELSTKSWLIVMHRGDQDRLSWHLPDIGECEGLWR